VKLRASPPYLLVAAVIFLVEASIAAFVRDRWIGRSAATCWW
jgi:hypothetical protein